MVFTEVVMSTAVTDIGQDLAKEALELQIQSQELADKLDAKKEELRDLANGKKMNITVEGLGKIDVTEPRQGSEKVVLTFDEERLKTVPELRQKLLDKGVAKEEVKKTPPARASVRIKPNV